jgi:hypothetical protein
MSDNVDSFDLCTYFCDVESLKWLPDWIKNRSFHHLSQKGETHIKILLPLVSNSTQLNSTENTIKKKEQETKKTKEKKEEEEQCTQKFIWLHNTEERTQAKSHVYIAYVKTDFSGNAFQNYSGKMQQGLRNDLYDREVIESKTSENTDKIDLLKPIIFEPKTQLRDCEVICDEKTMCVEKDEGLVVVVMENPASFIKFAFKHDPVRNEPFRIVTNIVIGNAPLWQDIKTEIAKALIVGYEVFYIDKDYKLTRLFVSTEELTKSSTNNENELSDKGLTFKNFQHEISPRSASEFKDPLEKDLIRLVNSQRKRKIESISSADKEEKEETKELEPPVKKLCVDPSDPSD